MTDIPIAEAKARLSELVARVAAGEPIRITRRGKPVAELTSLPIARRPIDVNALRALTAHISYQTESAGEFVRRMRDEDRY